MVPPGGRHRSTFHTMNPSCTNVFKIDNNKSNLRMEIISVAGTSKKHGHKNDKYGDQLLGRAMS